MNAKKTNQAIEKAVEAVAGGGVIVFPTDTAYGLGADATNEKAVRGVFSIKKRDQSKPLHIVVSDAAMAHVYGVIDPKTEKLMDAFLPGPLTVVVPRKPTLPDILTGGKETVGIRIPDNEVALTIVEKLQKPITATSANKSGDPAPYSIAEVKESFGKEFGNIDFVIDAGALPHVLPSTLVELAEGEVSILREGPITREEIAKVVS